jgi:hypothetical protein
LDFSVNKICRFVYPQVLPLHFDVNEARVLNHAQISQDNKDEHDHEQGVDEIASATKPNRAYIAKQPQYDEDHDNQFQHGFLLLETNGDLACLFPMNYFSLRPRVSETMIRITAITRIT